MKQIDQKYLNSLKIYNILRMDIRFFGGYTVCACVYMYKQYYLIITGLLLCIPNYRIM